MTRGVRTQEVVVSNIGPALVEYSVNGKTYENQTLVDSFDPLWLPTALTGGFTVLLGLCSVGTGLWFFLNRKRKGSASQS